MTTPREPIVDAVLKDPVVVAAMADPSAGPAISEAVGHEVLPVTTAPETPPAPTAERRIVQTTSLGTTTTRQTGGTVTTDEGKLVAAPTSTEEENRGTAGQREVNMLWEHTQMRIALSVVGSVMASNLLVVIGMLYVLVCYWKTLDPITIAILVAVLTGALGSLTSMGTLVIGFYFGRTNHQKVGGVQVGR